jgi:integrase
MASTWITTRSTADGGKRYRVMWRYGGRSTYPRYAGSFKTRREAKLRRDWIAGELAANRTPQIGPPEIAKAPTLTAAAKRWQDSRVDVAESTRVQHSTALKRVLPILGSHRVVELVPADVAHLVGKLVEQGKARESIRKSVTALAMVLDYANVDPNPARDRITVKLPREEPEEFNPPSAEHVEAVYRRLPAQHRLALLFLDWSGARVAAIDHTLVGDYDQSRRRVRLRAATTKTRRALWVELHPALADALEARLPHPRFRDPTARLFVDSGANALRTAIAKACKAAGIPLFSPHDLRHRRISLLHLRGIPWARIGEFVGQRNLSVTADTYTHVLVDETELDYPKLLAQAHS